jgi:hypothetical protein
VRRVDQDAQHGARRVQRIARGRGGATAVGVGTAARLAAAPRAHDAADRQPERSRRQLGRVVEQQQRAPRLDERLQRGSALRAQPTRVLRRRLSRGHAALGLAQRHVGDHQHVVARPQVARAHRRVGDALVRDLVLVEQPARPALVHVAGPRLVQPHPWRRAQRAAGRQRGHRAAVGARAGRRVVGALEHERPGRRRRAAGERDRGLRHAHRHAATERRHRDRVAARVARVEHAVARAAARRRAAALARGGDHVHLAHRRGRGVEALVHLVHRHAELVRQRPPRDVVRPLLRSAGEALHLREALQLQQILGVRAVRLRHRHHVAARRVRLAPLPGTAPCADHVDAADAQDLDQPQRRPRDRAAPSG